MVYGGKTKYNHDTIIIMIDKKNIFTMVIGSVRGLGQGY